MSKKVFQLASAVIGGVQTIAVALVTYFQPEHATEINASILIAGTAIIEICSQFTKE